MLRALTVPATLDFLAIGMAEVGSIAERRTFLLLDPEKSGLPAFLSPEAGVSSGLMIVQYLQAALTIDPQDVRAALIFFFRHLDHADREIATDAFMEFTRVPDQVIGEVAIYRTEVRGFSERQVSLIENFADQAVIAIENARLLGELRDRNDEIAGWNRELEARVAEQVEELGRVRPGTGRHADVHG